MLVKATCLYLATKLGDLTDEIVIVGGLAPSSGGFLKPMNSPLLPAGRGRLNPPHVILSARHGDLSRRSPSSDL